MFVLGRDKTILSKPPQERGNVQAKSFGHHPLEGDGLSMVSLYYYLWKRNRQLKGCQVMIPDTVVFDGMMPRAWYLYDEKNQEIKKKGLREVSIMSIKREFSKPSRADGRVRVDTNTIVAQYVYAAGFTMDGEEIVTIEFLAEEELETFLTKRPKKGSSMLQKFIPPKGSYNGLVQAIWSPFVFKCERRQNVHKLMDQRWSRFERAVTYEGPFYYSQQAFCAPGLEGQIRSLCESVVNHVNQTEKKTITRMVLYFKVDAADQVWLLWSNCLRLNDKMMPTKRLPMNLSQLYSPPLSETCSNWLRSGQRANSRSASPSRSPSASPTKEERAPTKSTPDQEGRPIPLIMEEPGSCPNCGRQIEKEDKYFLTIESIVKCAARRKARPRKAKEVDPHGRILFDTNSSDPPRHREEGDDVLLKNHPAYADILVDASHAPVPQRSQRNTREAQSCSVLFQHIDNVMYEAYSHFQVTRKPYRFVLQVDTGLASHDKCLKVLETLPNCKRVGHKAVGADTYCSVDGESTSANDWSSLTQSTPGAKESLTSVLLHPHTDSPPPTPTLPSTTAGWEPKAKEESHREDSEVQSMAASRSSRMAKKKRRKRKSREEGSLDSGSESGGTSTEESARSSGSRSSSSSGSTASSPGRKPRRRNSGSSGAGSAANGEATVDESALPEAWAEASSTAASGAPEKRGELCSVYFEIRWSTTLSLLHLQKHFQAAKFAAAVELYPRGHPRRRLLRGNLASAQMLADNSVALLEFDTPAVVQPSPSPVPSGTITSTLSAADSHNGTRIGVQTCANARRAAGIPQNSEGVPTILLAVMPKLTNAQFALLKSEPTFLNQHLTLCESCFLMYTDVSAHELHHYRLNRTRRGVKAKVQHINKLSRKRLATHLSMGQPPEAPPSTFTTVPQYQGSKASPTPTRLTRRYSDVQTFNAMLC